MATEKIVEIEISMGFESVLEDLVDQLNNRGSSINLGSGLPDIFTNSRSMRKAWGQVLDDDKGISLFLKSIMSNFELPKQVSKELLSWPASKQAGLLGKLMLVPQLRVAKHGDYKLTGSELMMARLMKFPEYSELSIDSAVDLVCNSLVSQRHELFGGAMSAVAEVASSIYYDPRDVARLVRLSRLDSKIRGIEDLPPDQKNDLVAGIFGLLDVSGLSLFFCLLLDDYEHLRPYFSKTAYAVRAEKAKSKGVYEQYLMDLLLRDAMDTDLHKSNSITYHMRTLGGFAPFKRWHAASSTQQLRSVNEEFQHNLAVAKQHISSLVDLEVFQPFDDLSQVDAFHISDAFIECSTLSEHLTLILDHPFIVSLANKDKEKEALVEELKTLDHSDPESAMRFADKIKALCQTVDNAPSDLIQSIETLRVLSSRYSSLFNEKFYIPTHESVETQDLANEHVDSAEHVEVLKKLESSVERERVLSDDLAKSKKRIEALEHKLSEQRTMNATLKRSAQIPVVASSKPTDECEGGVGPLVEFAVKNAVRTPEDMLRLLATAYPARIEVLESAYESARGAATYRHVTKLGGVLFTLVTDYLDAIMGGQPDSTARTLLGDTLRARESDGVLGNQRLRALREFAYKGEPRLFIKHLALGNKPGVAFSVRVYFDIIDDKVVIAYCGQHLETISSS